MADRVHPTPPPPPPEAPHQQQPDATAAATETTPLQEQEQHPSFNRPPAPAPGTYIIQIPKDQVLRVPPPDRARRYAKLAARPARRRRLRRACCLAFSALLLLLLLFAAFAGAVYLVFRPQAPSFSVASLSITNLTTLSFTNNLTTLSSSSSSSSPAIVVADVRADNTRNKKAGIEYRGGGEVRVAYAGAVLAWGPWPPFRQPPRNVTAFKASLTGNGGVRLTEEQRRQLGREEAARAVPMTVEATVPVRVRLGKVVRTWTVDVRATCHVDVDRMDGTPAAVEDRGCRVRVKPLWWWW